MVNKKGYIRTLEAIIAIVLVFIFIISILPKEEKISVTPKDIDLTAEGILNEIQNNKDYRNYVIGMDLTDGKCGEKDCYTEVNADIKNGIIPITIDYILAVCDISQNTVPCYPDINTIEFPKTDIYPRSILITEVNTKRVVKLFLWRKA